MFIWGRQFLRRWGSQVSPSTENSWLHELSTSLESTPHPGSKSGTVVLVQQRLWEVMRTVSRKQIRLHILKSCWSGPREVWGLSVFTCVECQVKVHLPDGKEVFSLRWDSILTCLWLPGYQRGTFTKGCTSAMEFYIVTYPNHLKDGKILCLFPYEFLERKFLDKVCNYSMPLKIRNSSLVTYVSES